MAISEGNCAASESISQVESQMQDIDYQIGTVSSLAYRLIDLLKPVLMPDCDGDVPNEKELRQTYVPHAEALRSYADRLKNIAVELQSAIDRLGL